MPKLNTKPSHLRYRAMLEDVHQRAYYALNSGDHSNPFPVDDKRHERFAKKLAHVLFLDSEFEDMCDVMGTPTSGFVKRVIPHPGPVRTLHELAAAGR